MPTHASRTEIIAIGKKLEAVCRKTSDGLCEYIDRNITDETVAKELSVKESSVRSLRREIYGALFAKRNKTDDGMIEEIKLVHDQLAEADRQNRILAARIDGLVRVIEEILKPYNTLVGNLAMNRVADVRHLTIDIGILARLKGVNGADPTATRR